MTKDDFKYYFPYIGTILILMGAIKLIVFYSLFGFKISPYLELSEILTLFLNDLLYLGSIFVFQFLFMFLMQPNSELESISKELNATLNGKNFFKRLYSYAVNGVNLLIIILIWIVGIPFWLWFSTLSFKFYFYFLLAILGGLILTTILYEIRRQWYVKYNEYPKMIYTNIAKVFTFLLIMTICVAYSDYDSIKNKKIYKGTVIKLSDKTVVSDSFLYYIGKTKNYVFLNNERDSSIMIIPMTEIKGLIIKKNSR